MKKLEWYCVNSLTDRIGPFPSQEVAWAKTMGTGGVPIDGSMVWCVEAARKNVKANEIPLSVIAEYRRGYEERTGSQPIIVFGRSVQAARQLIGACGVDKAKKIAREFGARPPEWHLKNGATDFPKIISAATKIVERSIETPADGLTPEEAAFLRHGDELAE